MLLVIILSVPIAVYLLGRETKLFTFAFGTKANLVVDLGNSQDDSSYVWKNFAQGGEEQGRMLAPVVDEVATLEPEYIRIDHIYDFHDIVSRDNGQLVFNFSSLDQTVDDILATGALPFFSLSYMPKALSSGSEVDQPLNWSDWENLVQKTIEHYSGLQGYALNNVYYEVWNEPDLFGNYKTYGDKNYLNLYLHSSLGATRARNVLPFKLGGPATTSLYKNWTTNLLNFVAENNLKLDFYSWHTYSFDLDKFEKDLLDARRWLADYPGYQNIELIISEAGPDSENNEAYDNNFGAIHTIATAATTEDTHGKIFNFEIKDGPGPTQYWRRWGMFTHEKFGLPVAKPRAAAFTFLNQIRGDRVALTGEGSWVKAIAKREENIYRVLVVNYDASGKHFEAVPIAFVNVPTDGFRFTRTDFGGGVVRALEVLPQDISEFAWITTESFNPNTAAIFEITPL